MRTGHAYHCSFAVCMCVRVCMVSQSVCVCVCVCVYVCFRVQKQCRDYVYRCLLIACVVCDYVCGHRRVITLAVLYRKSVSVCVCVRV